MLPGFQALCRRLTRDHVRVIMYHRFSPEGQDHPRRLPAREFAWQAAYLARHHRGWTPEQQLAAAGRPLAGRGGPAVVITVDDGYADFVTIAHPILALHNLPAMVFLTTEFVSGCTWFWWDKLIWLLENWAPGQSNFHFDDRRIQGDPANTEVRWSIWHAIADHLSSISDSSKEAALEYLAKQAGIEIPETPPADYAAMNWQQIRQLAQEDIVFGAHTLTHPVLSRVDSERAAQEIRESGKRLADELGQAIHWFCYPQGGPGDFSADTTHLVREAGYRGCYAAFPDPHHDGDVMTLPRYSVDEDRINFQWILCGAEHLFLRWKSRRSNRKGSK